MKIYKNTLNILTLIFVFLYPILPSYGEVNSDKLLHLIILIQIVGFIIFKKERQEVIQNIKKLKNDKIILSALALNILMYISSIYSVNKESTLLNSIIFSLFIIVYYTIAYTIKEKVYVKGLLISFLSVSVLSSFVSIYQTFITIEDSLMVDKDNRIISFLENSNNLGAYSILSIFIFVMLIVSSKKLSKKIFFSACTLLLATNIILSQSRNALLGLILGFILMAFLYNKRFVIYSSALLVILFIIPQSQERLLQIFDMSQNSSRIKIWKLTTLIIKDNPILGTGYETYSGLYTKYAKANPDLMNWSGYVAIHPHNVLLKFQSELGILGTIFIVLFIVFTLITLIKEMKNAKTALSKAILTGITISFIVFSLMNLIDSYYNILKITLTLFVVLGISNNHFRQVTVDNSLHHVTFDNSHLTGSSSDN